VPEPAEAGGDVGSPGKVMGEPTAPLTAGQKPARERPSPRAKVRTRREMPQGGTGGDKLLQGVKPEGLGSPSLKRPLKHPGNSNAQRLMQPPEKPRDLER